MIRGNRDIVSSYKPPNLHGLQTISHIKVHLVHLQIKYRYCLHTMERNKILPVPANILVTLPFRPRSSNTSERQFFIHKQHRLQ